MKRTFRIRRGLSVVLAMLLVAGLGAALAALADHQNASAETSTTMSGTGSGVRLPPVIHRGANLSPPAQAKPVPLVIALHGANATPTQFQATGLNQVADTNGFVVAYLGSTAPLWKDPSNITYISSMITQLTASENIDRSRVYVTGFSLGGYATYRSACELSRQVAAVAVVSNVMAPLWHKPCPISRPVAELDIVGSDDLVPVHKTPGIPISTDQTAHDWRRLDGCPGHASMTQVGPVTQTMWAPCNDGSAVGEYVVQGGIHTWPGSPGRTGADAQYDASAAIWRFFAAHSAPSATQVSAALSSLSVSRTRRVTAMLTLGESNVKVVMTISSRRRVVTTARLAVPVQGRQDVSASVPRSAPAGPSTVVLTMHDSYGRSLQISRTIQLPGT